MKFITLLFLPLLSAAWYVQDSHIVEKIKEVERALNESKIKHDKGKLSELIADDFTFIHPTGAVETKAQYIESILTGKLKTSPSDVDVMDYQIRVYENHTVVVTQRSVARALHSGQEVRIRNVSVYALVRGQWKWVSSQSTRLPDRPKAADIPPTVYNHYVGKYAINGQRVFTIAKVGERLVIQGLTSFIPEEELIPVTETEYIRFSEENDWQNSRFLFSKPLNSKTVTIEYRAEGKEVWRATRIVENE